MSFKTVQPRYKDNIFILISFSSFFFLFSSFVNSAIPNGHAHNDYNQERPLFDALSHGFRSIEVDIHLVRQNLYVAHTFAGIRPGRTLERLYLDPLLEWIRDHDGRVYNDSLAIFLLVDIKSGAVSTYMRLRMVLKEYEDILHVFGKDDQNWKPVVVVLSGNRPKKLMSAETIRYAAYDGRSADLDSDVPRSLMPIISEKWSRLFSWRGKGPVPEDERKKLQTTVERAHQSGRMIRFWATPNAPSRREAIWEVLMDAGVDLINIDDLSGFYEFHSRKSSTKY